MASVKDAYAKRYGDPQAGFKQTQGGSYYNPATGQSVADLPGFLRKNELQTRLSDPASYSTGIDYDQVLNRSAPQQLSFEQMTQMADPNAGQRQEYANKLKSLLENPDSIADTGVYKFAFDQGNQALQRSAAARGMTGSGNTLAELMKYGQGYASQQFGNYADRLSGLANLNKDNSNTLNSFLGQGQDRARLGLEAAGMKANDYWNAQKLGTSFGTASDYYRPMQW